MTVSNKDRKFIHSLSKGLRALQYFAETNEPTTLSELARALGIDKTTATRICHTLLTLGFIWRDENKKYNLTLKVLALGYSAITQLNWREVADQYLRVFSDEIQEEVNLSILEDFKVLRLIRYAKKGHNLSNYGIGIKLPVHCTASGKVLMAMNPATVTNPILDKVNFRPLTPHTITNKKDFQKELNVIKKNGYAISYEEFSIGIATVAAPILDVEGNAFAAVNVGLLTENYNRKEIQQNIAPRVLDAAQQISKALADLESRTAINI